MITSASETDPSASAYATYVAWKKWDRLFAYTPEQARYFAGEMRGMTVADADLLEIGYGSGDFLAWARDKGARVSGVEIVPALAQAARDRQIPLLPPDLESVVTEYTSAFDTIIAFDVFEHLTADVIATRLATCAGMLRPGGHLVLRFPNGQSPFGLVPQGGDPTHRTMLSRSAIEQLMQGTPLRVLRYEPAFRITGGGGCKGLARRLRYIARDMISTFLNAIYAESIPWDAVVVIVLQKGDVRRA